MAAQVRGPVPASSVTVNPAGLAVVAGALTAQAALALLDARAVANTAAIATKADLAALATKADLAALATKADPSRRFRRTKHARKVLASRDPFTIWIEGDSIGRGNAASLLAKTWARLLQRKIQDIYGPAPANLGYVSVNSYTEGLTDTRPPWTITGTHVAFNGGMCAQADYIYGGPTSFASATFTGDRVQVYYVKSVNTNSLSIILDGGAPVVIDTNTAGVNSTGWVWDSGPIAAGNHTLVVRPTNADGAIALDGYYPFNGDFANPVRLFNSCDAGLYASSLGSLSQSVWESMQAVIKPDLVIIEHARYEQFNLPEPIPAATFKTQMQTLIDNYRAVCTPDPTIVLLGIYACGDKPEATFIPYHNALMQLSDENDVELVDLYDRIGWQNSWGPGDWTADEIHPRDRGGQLIADLLGDVLLTA